MLCMILYPNKKEQLQRALDLITPTGLALQDGSGDRLLTTSDITNCDYLNYCLKESQR